MRCPVCGNDSFNQAKVLTQRLIDEWELNLIEVDYINKQQGFYCSNCLCNLRSMTLAEAIMNHYDYKGQFQQFCYSKYGRKLRLLEINEAGNLHDICKRFRNYIFAEYPSVDIHELPYKENAFDCIVHSDTLEHVSNTRIALHECWRVLKTGGTLFYTIPIIYGRMTRRRDSLSDSFHGSQEESQGEDFKVFTEYGADFWVELIEAGFTDFTITTINDCSSLAICAKKQKQNDYAENKFIANTLTLWRKIKKIHTHI